MKRSILYKKDLVNSQRTSKGKELKSMSRRKVVFLMPFGVRILPWGDSRGISYYVGGELSLQDSPCLVWGWLLPVLIYQGDGSYQKCAKRERDGVIDWTVCFWWGPPRRLEGVWGLIVGGGEKLHWNVEVDGFIGRFSFLWLDMFCWFEIRDAIVKIAGCWGEWNNAWIPPSCF